MFLEISDSRKYVSDLLNRIHKPLKLEISYGDIYQIY